MSSQNNNNEQSAMIFVAAILCAAAFAAIVFIFALATFTAFVMTIICFFAWNRPRRLGKEVLMPEEARAFVYRGLAGAVLLPVFAIFCDLVFGVYIRGDVLPYLVIGGYVVGSLGIEILMAEEAQQQQQSIQVIPPQMPVQRAQPSLPSNKPPFRYASWDDEEAGR
jgi:hypothetical protein